MSRHAIKNFGSSNLASAYTAASGVLHLVDATPFAGAVPGYVVAFSEADSKYIIYEYTAVDDTPGTDTLTISGAVGTNPDQNLPINTLIQDCPIEQYLAERDLKIGNEVSGGTINTVLKIGSDGNLACGAIAQSSVSNLTTDLAAKATDSLVVHKAGGDTITCSTAATKGLIVKAGTTAKTISNVALTSNVATITTTTPHGFIVGQSGTNTGLTTSLNDSYAIASVPTTTTFTYAKTAANIASVADSGTATANQTANLFEAQTPAATALFSITAAGQVGIGTSQPDRLLHCNGTFHQYIHFSTTSGVNYDVAMQFSDTTYTIYEGLLGNAAGPGCWGVYMGGVKFMITPSGNVGINTVAPGAQLQVNASAATTKGVIVKGFTSQSADLQQWQDSTGTTMVSIASGGQFTAGTVISTRYYVNSTGKSYIWYDGDGNGQLALRDDTAGVVRLVVDPSGNFGINLSSPGAQLQVNTSAATTKGMIVKGFTSQSANLQEWQSSTGTVLTCVDASGKVAIGASSTSYPLTVKSGTAGFAFDALNQVFGTTFGSGGSFEIRAEDPASTNGGSIFFGGSTRGDNRKSAIVFGVNGTEHFRLDGDFTGHTAGNFGFGTNTPTTKVDINGEVKAKGIATAISAVKTTAYTITTADSTILGDGTSAAFAITLPAASGVPAGRLFTVKKVDVSANAITLTRAGSDTIDGASTFALASQWKYVSAQSDGVSKWYVVANN